MYDRATELRSLAARVRLIVERADLFLDTETTDRDGSEIVEIGIVDRDGHVLLQALVRPLGAIDPAASAVHGITAATVASAALWPELWPAVSGIIRGRALACYNAAFDARAVANSCQRHYLDLAGSADRVGVCWLDVMEPFAAWYGEWNEHYHNYRYQKLATALQCADPVGHLGEARNSHRAADDAAACRQVLLWLDRELQQPAADGF